MTRLFSFNCSFVASCHSFVTVFGVSAPEIVGSEVSDVRNKAASAVAAEGENAPPRRMR